MVSILLAMLVALEAAAREERERLSAEARLMEREMIIDRLRYWSRVSSVVWGIVGAAVGVTVTAVVF
ncbi:MAG: hypothetical protein WD492_16645 [Alkalispirochaeta sp.]